jgi:hypothetical protein
MGPTATQVWVENGVDATVIKRNSSWSMLIGASFMTTSEVLTSAILK